MFRAFSTDSGRGPDELGELDVLEFAGTAGSDPVFRQ